MCMGNGCVAAPLLIAGHYNLPLLSDCFRLKATFGPDYVARLTCVRRPEGRVNLASMALLR